MQETKETEEKNKDGITIQELTEKINTTQYSNSKEFYTNLVMSLLEYILKIKKCLKVY